VEKVLVVLSPTYESLVQPRRITLLEAQKEYMAEQNSEKPMAVLSSQNNLWWYEDMVMYPVARSNP